MGLGEVFSNFGEKIKGLLSGFPGFSSVKDRNNTNSRVVLVIAAALSIIIVLLLVLAIVSHTKTGTNEQYVNDTILRERFSAEDFFLPHEPDFVPDVLLEREPKDIWTEEDARPFWTDPLKGNEGTWRKRIESEIDSLLEHVP